MFTQFFKYFLHYIFHAKTRQRLLFVAMVGLIISSFALIVVQSAMGGLQNNLMTRAKNIVGASTIFLKDKSKSTTYEILSRLQQRNIDAVPEYELEMLLRVDEYLSPVIVHGITKDLRPKFLKDLFLRDVIVPTDLAFKYGISPNDELKLISTTHVDTLLTDIPRVVTGTASDTITTEVAEIDLLHIWARVELLHNLIRKIEFNKIRVYDPISKSDLEKILGEFNDSISITTWEEENNSLVYALKLESTVMISLFIAMTLLVSLSIISGLLIFYSKIKMDISSFWILGVARKKLERSTFLFFNIISLFSVLIGLGLGLAFLIFLDHNAFEIMPDIFVDRNIPILITGKGIAISFGIPFLISAFFITVAVHFFDKDETFLDNVRATS